MKPLFAGLLWVVSALVGAPAHAVLIQQVYTGSVVSGTDVEGIFGAAGSLAGRTFRAVFVFDTAAGSTSTGSIGGPGSFVQLAGGTSFAVPTPLVSATLSIGTSSAITVAGGVEDRTSVRSSLNPVSLPSEYFSRAFGINGDVLTVFVRSFAATYPADLTVPGTYLSSAGTVTGDTFRIVNPVTFSDRAQGVLSTASLVVSVVPEPGIALLMAAGAAGLGLRHLCGHRRRRG